MGEVDQSEMLKIFDKGQARPVRIHHRSLDARRNHDPASQKKELVAERVGIHHGSVGFYPAVVRTRLLEGIDHFRIAKARLFNGVAEDVFSIISRLPLFVGKDPYGLLEKDAGEVVEESKAHIGQSLAQRHVLGICNIAATTSLGC